MVTSKSYFLRSKGICDGGWCLSMQNKLQLRIQYIAIIPITSVIICTVHSRVNSMHFLPGVGFWNTHDETRLFWESATATLLLPVHHPSPQRGETNHYECHSKLIAVDICTIHLNLLQSPFTSGETAGWTRNIHTAIMLSKLYRAGLNSTNDDMDSPWTLWRA